MRDLRDLKDLTIHLIQPISDDAPAFKGKVQLCPCLIELTTLVTPGLVSLRG